MDLVALKAEINTDPAVLGYAAILGDHPAIAALINRVGRLIDSDGLSSGALVSCLDKAEFTALNAGDKAYLNLFVTVGDVPMTQEIRQSLRALFPVGSKTRVNINAATKRNASRGDELGLGHVTASDVADALRS